jgi:hypothetical protein
MQARIRTEKLRARTASHIADNGSRRKHDRSNCFSRDDVANRRLHHTDRWGGADHLAAGAGYGAVCLPVALAARLLIAHKDDLMDKF